ncbi:SURF1 family protein [Falsarthrobacter nasiphocae]|uniref:SURF1-like protein n=1 Tax=Falsarthrobacter nasiphocae TaxID=189863 RepID=A0AAE3YE89_9MICC|nr:SURF1 family protein [Falsarthrobacter nasiphocae]MDR6891137.1 cytochrome oxidase assembly protein ShyY1 [Falsarthrobacter nasiphocae]
MTEQRLTQPLQGRERWRFLASPQWAGWFLFTCLIAIVCSMLGQWQLHRRDEVRATNAKVAANYDRSPVAYAEARDQFADLDPSQEWLPVRVSGTYLAEKSTVIRNRTNTSQAGYDIVVPLRTASGDVIAVNRGWVPLGSAGQGRPDEVPAPPSGEVTVTVRLRPGEPHIGRSAPAGQAASIELPFIAAQTGLPLEESAYGQLVSEDPAPAQSLRPGERPATDEGPHLSYAMQWYTFGLMAFVGLGYAARRHAQDVDDDREWQARQDLEAAGGAPSELSHPVLRASENAQRRKAAKAGRRGGQTDEAEEDALLGLT